MANPDLNKFRNPAATTEIKFLSMNPQPPRRRVQLIVESRTGVNDYSVWTDASRSDNGTIQTVADTDDYERDARLYNSFIGFPFDIFYDGHLLPDRYIIRNVQMTKTSLLFGKQIIAQAVPNAIIRATWDIFVIRRNP